MKRSLVKMVVSILVGSAGLLALGGSAATPTRAQYVPSTRRVVVVVRDFRNDSGQLIGGLYTSPAVWLGENRAAADCHAPIRGREARCVFDVPTTTRVAFAGMHDEDSDGALDRDFFGLPQEGYAFSNDVREPFGPPSFEAASFRPLEVLPFIVHARYGI
jgi:uncharacterized protein (DUF2141 family)